MSSGIGRGFARHRFDIEVQHEIRVTDRIQQTCAFGAGVDEVGLGRRQRFQAQPDTAIRYAGHRLTEHFRGVVECLVPRNAIGQRPLLRRAEHHEVTAEVACRLGESDEVVGGSRAYAVVGGRQVQAFSSGQQPVQPDNLDTGIRGLVPQLSALSGIEIGDERRKRKRRELEPLIADALHVSADAIEWPAFE